MVVESRLKLVETRLPSTNGAVCLEIGEISAIWKMVLSEGLTGAEIEAVFLEAMFAAFEHDKEPTEMDIAAAMNTFVPLSKLMAEQIAGLKQWSVGRARPSTSTSSTSERKLRKLGV